MINERAPAHVPAHLVRDFNYLDSSSHTDVYRFFGELHQGPDIFYTMRNFGHWVVTRFADMEYILGHTAEFNSETHTVPKEGKPFPIPLTEYDGAPHAELRKLLMPFFVPKAVRDLQARMRELTDSLIDQVLAQGECDFTRDFALKMPIGIMMHVLGLPASDTPYLLRQADDLVRGDTPEIRGNAFRRVFDYIGDKVIKGRQSNSGAGIFGCLIQSRIDGGRLLTDLEIKGLGSLLVAAGLDTVANMLCFFAHFLAEHPGHCQQLLDDPGLCHDAIEEIMRRYHIVNVARMIVHDLEYKGVTFKAGEAVLIPTTLAGIDERRYANPLTVDFSRNDKKTLVFGHGPHLCIGSFLARTELRMFLDRWLLRIPHFSVKSGAKVISMTGRANSIPSLPLVWGVG